ncbi:hypothetical protein [Achromobacter aloeverae]
MNNIKIDVNVAALMLAAWRVGCQAMTDAPMSKQVLVGDHHDGQSKDR